MTSDRYTKTVLTVIAACLVWLCARPLFEPAKVAAQDGITRVSVVGWFDGKTDHKLKENDYKYGAVPVFVTNSTNPSGR